MSTYLVRAPVPGGQYSETQSHAGPGQVSGDGVSEQVHGVLARQVAGAVGNDLAGHGHTVHVLQVAKATDLVESCGRARHVANRTALQKVNTFLLCVLIQSKQTSDGEDDRSDDHDKRLQRVSVDDSSETAYEAKERGVC